MGAAVARVRKSSDYNYRPGTNVTTLAADHPALVDRTTMFPGTIVRATAARSVLKSGQHSSKTGGRISVGRWKGFPIHTLTLVERETCPRSCQHWADCY